MAFNEREAIRIRMENIAEQKKVLYQRDRELDKEYNFYIERLRELDKDGLGSGTGLTYESREPQPSKGEPKKEYDGNLKQYDFDALKRGLSNFKKKPERQEKVEVQVDPYDRRKRGKQYNLEEVAKVVETILKETGEPLAIHKLRDILSEKGYTWKHFLPTLPNIMKHSEHLEKPYRGHVVYVENPENNQISNQAAMASDEIASGVEVNVREAAGEIPDSAVSNKDRA